MDEIDEAGMVADAGDPLERVEDRREKEPGQKERRDEVLDVPVDGIQRRDRE